MSTSNPRDQQPRDLPRRVFLKESAALAGAGVLWTMAGGTFSAQALAGGGRQAAQAVNLSFVQITDTHVGAHTPANPNVVGTFEQAIQRINALPDRPAFVVHTGDHVHLSKPKEFDTVKQLLRTIKTDRVFNLPGEHDVFLDRGKQYLQVFGQGSQGSGYWSFDLHGIHFIGLANDSGLVGQGQGTLGAEQLNFVEKDVAGLSSATPLVLFSHVPLLPVYLPWGWATSDSGQLLALVKRFHTVTALNGHIHQVVSKRVGNVVMHTADSTAYPLHPPGQVAPSPLVVPAAQLPTRIGIRAVQVQGAADALTVKDRPLA
jgi:3',5'-cyclic AMP phosphodiesterase CpdA